MRNRHFIAGVVTIVAAFVSLSHAEVTVQFIDPGKFTDLSLSGSTTAGIQRHITRERVSDLNYLMLADPGYVYNDPLRYEKAMLRRWFLDRFSGSPAAPDAAHGEVVKKP